MKFQKIMGSFEEKLTKKIHTTFLYACLKASKLKSKNNRWIERKSFKGASKTKKKKTLEEIDFHNLIQDEVFTTVYRL